jgi:hypothetical protein
VGSGIHVTYSTFLACTVKDLWNINKFYPIVLYCIVLYCIVLHCIALHCIAFYSILFFYDFWKAYVLTVIVTLNGSCLHIYLSEHVVEGERC